MSQLRFNYVFMGLMFVSGLCAFLFPVSFASHLRGHIDFAFTPVSYPVRKIAIAATGHLGASDTVDAGKLGSGEARQEIERLRNSLSNLTFQLDELRRRNNNRDLAGDVRQYSVPFRIVGGDTAGRALFLQGSASDGIAVKQPVLCREGLVGSISSLGASGAQVQLITDRNFRASVRIGTFTSANDRSSFVPRSVPQPLAEGRDKGKVSILNLPRQQVKDAGILVGDYVVLRDDEWNSLVDGQVIGTIEAIVAQDKAPLFADLMIKPAVNLMQLDEAMVVTGKLNPAAKPITPKPVVNSTLVNSPIAKKPLVNSAPQARSTTARPTAPRRTSSSTR